MTNINEQELEMVTGGVTERPDGSTCTDPLPGQEWPGQLPPVIDILSGIGSGQEVF